MSGHLCVIDGSNMLQRAWAMGKPRQRAVDGLEIGATWLFSQMVVKLLRRMTEGRMPTTHAVIFFDPPREDSWRREVYEGYKAHREPMDEKLALQIPVMKEFVRDIGLGEATAARHEADDLIAAYTEDAVARGDRVSIMSTDKDLMQLIRPRVMQLNDPAKKWYNEVEVEKKFEVPAALLGDFLALAGDSVDGVPGAPGIGPKTAAALLAEFGSLSALLARSEEIQRPSWRKIISENKEQIRLSRMLVSLDAAGAPRPLSLREMEMPRGNFTGRAHDWREQVLA